MSNEELLNIFARWIVITSIACIFFIGSVNALSISMADRSAIGGINFQVFEINETGTTLIGDFNTTTSVTGLNGTASYLMVFEPYRTDYLANPALIVTDGGAYLADNVLPLIAIIFLIALLRRR